MAGWLKYGNPPGDFSTARRCGACGKRSGQPCRGPAMRNGRCRLHGGLSTGPPHAGRTRAQHKGSMDARPILRGGAADVSASESPVPRLQFCSDRTARPGASGVSADPPRRATRVEKAEGAEAARLLNFLILIQALGRFLVNEPHAPRYGSVSSAPSRIPRQDHARAKFRA